MKTFETLAKTIAFHAATSSVDLGNAGERLAIALFRDCGYVSQKITERHSGDILATDYETGERHKIEVKISRASKAKSPRWQFCINKDGFTSCGYSDFCLLIAVYRGGVACYLIPANELKGVKKLEISHPLTYRGKLKKYQIDTQKPMDFSCLSEMKNAQS